MNKQAILSLSALLVVSAASSFTIRRSLNSPRSTTTVAIESSPAIPAEIAVWIDEFERLPLTSAFAQSIRAAVQSVRAAPHSSDSWIRLGDVLTARSRAMLDISLYKKTERIYLQAYQLDRTNAHSLAGLAWAAGAAHRFDDSVAWATLAIRADPEIPAAYAILGDSAVELGRYDEAARHYQKMLDLQPDMGAYSRAAHLMYLEGNVPRAMSLIRKALDAAGGDPDQSAWCVAELGMMQCREGAAPLAVRLVDEWLKRAPENPTLLAASGQAHMAANQDEAAIASIKHAISIVPQHATLAALHDLYLASGRIQDADHVAVQIEELHRQFQQEQIQGGEGQLARFYADRGVKPDEAVSLAEKEYSHHSGAVAADTLAWAYFRAGRTTDAQKLLPEILRRRVTDPAMLYHTGLIEEALGHVMDARRHLYAALSREPRFNPVHSPIAQAALQRLSSVVDIAALVERP